MPVNFSNLTDFFRTTFDEPYESYAPYEAGYAISHLDILVQKARRSKKIAENRLFDFIQLDNDPNYDRSALNNSETIQKIVSKLSMSTQIMAVINSNIIMAGVSEFIPTNIRKLLFNYQGLADTGINVLSTIKQQITFKQIEQAFLSDLRIQIGSGSLSFAQVVQMVDALDVSMFKQDKTLNSAIRPLLSLGLQNLFSEDISGVLESVQYLDKLYEMFVDDETLKLELTDYYGGELNSYKSRKVEDIVVNDYTNIYVDLSDPIGLIERNKFQQEIINDYNSFVIQMVDNSPGSLSQETKDELVDIFVEEGQIVINDTFTGRIGLPSFTDVASGAVSDTWNQTIDNINSAFQIIAVETIRDIGLNVSVEDIRTTRPIDLLQNMKKNIRARIQMKKVGGTSVAFTEINNYLETIIPDGDLSDTNLELLNSRIEEILKETVNVSG